MKLTHDFKRYGIAFSCPFRVDGTTCVGSDCIHFNVLQNQALSAHDDALGGVLLKKVSLKRLNFFREQKGQKSQCTNAGRGISLAGRAHRISPQSSFLHMKFVVSKWLFFLPKSILGGIIESIENVIEKEKPKYSRKRHYRIRKKLFLEYVYSSSSCALQAMLPCLSCIFIKYLHYAAIPSEVDWGLP